MTAAILPGAEAWSAEGGAQGALCLHGFTGDPSSMRGLAKAFAAAGFTVELPRLPGHGTTVEDMMTTSWPDWSAAAEDAYRSLAERCESVVVAGLSMGGALTVWLAARHPEIAGIVCINALVEAPAGMEDSVHQMLADGQTTIPGIGSDIADPGTTESAYADTPLVPMVSLFAAAEELTRSLGQVTCPTLILNSPEDHVVDPVNSDTLAERVGGPVERIALERSYHVATLDYDRDLIEQAALEFARKVSAG